MGVFTEYVNYSCPHVKYLKKSVLEWNRITNHGFRVLWKKGARLSLTFSQHIQYIQLHSPERSAASWETRQLVEKADGEQPGNMQINWDSYLWCRFILLIQQKDKMQAEFATYRSCSLINCFLLFPGHHIVRWTWSTATSSIWNYKIRHKDWQ